MTTVTYCEKHPERETGLRCNRCNKLICISCAKRTPTGYRCDECIRAAGKRFETAESQDYILAAAVAAGISLVGALAANFIGWLTIFIAPFFASLIVNTVRRVTEKRRSKQLTQAIIVATAVGGFLPLLGKIFLFGFFNLFGLLWPGVYAVFVAYTVYISMSGIQIRR